MFGEPTAQRWAEEAGETIDYAKEAHPFGALGGREHTPHNGGDQGYADASAQSLYRTESDQLVHTLRGARKNGAEQKERRAG